MLIQIYTASTVFNRARTLEHKYFIFRFQCYLKLKRPTLGDDSKLLWGLATIQNINKKLDEAWWDSNTPYNHSWWIRIVTKTAISSVFLFKCTNWLHLRNNDNVTTDKCYLNRYELLSNTTTTSGHRRSSFCELCTQLFLLFFVADSHATVTSLWFHRTVTNNYQQIWCHNSTYFLCVTHFRPF